MNIAEIINYTRTSILDDVWTPYLWTDLELITHFNKIYNEICRETRCLIDSTTTSIVRVPLLANQTMHNLASSIIYIYQVRREGDQAPIFKKTEGMGWLPYAWRNVLGTPYLMITDLTPHQFGVFPHFDTIGYEAGSVSAPIIFTASHTIAHVGGAFATGIGCFTTSDKIVVSGTTSNNGILTVDTVASNISMTVVETVTGESAPAGIMQKQRDAYLLKVARYPLVTYVPNDLALATPPTPEIDPEFHQGLAHGIASLAFGKQDSETYDKAKAATQKQLWEDHKGDVRWHIAGLFEGDTRMSPHFGAI